MEGEPVHQTCRGVESRPPNRGGSPKQQQKQTASRWRTGKRQNCRPGVPGNLAGTPGGSFLVSTRAKVSDGRSMSLWKHLANRSYSKLVVPTMILRVNWPKLTPGSAGPKRVVKHERILCRQERLCRSRRSRRNRGRDRSCVRPSGISGIRQESSRTGKRKFWGRRWLNESCTTLRDRSSCSGQRNRRKRHRWNTSCRPTRRIKINRASPN